MVFRKKVKNSRLGILAQQTIVQEAQMQKKRATGDYSSKPNNIDLL
jgi:hypothetical protein